MYSFAIFFLVIYIINRYIFYVAVFFLMFRTLCPNKHGAIRQTIQRARNLVHDAACMKKSLTFRRKERISAKSSSKGSSMACPGGFEPIPIKYWDLLRVEKVKLSVLQVFILHIFGPRSCGTCCCSRKRIQLHLASHNLPKKKLVRSRVLVGYWYPKISVELGCTWYTVQLLWRVTFESKLS